MLKFGYSKLGFKRKSSVSIKDETIYDYGVLR